MPMLTTSTALVGRHATAAPSPSPETKVDHGSSGARTNGATPRQRKKIVTVCCQTFWLAIDQAHGPRPNVSATMSAFRREVRPRAAQNKSTALAATNTEAWSLAIVSIFSNSCQSSGSSRLASANAGTRSTPGIGPKVLTYSCFVGDSTTL